jgi:hypothetical protein
MKIFTIFIKITPMELLKKFGEGNSKNSLQQPATKHVKYRQYQVVTKTGAAL